MKKINNKVLLIVLVALAVVFALSKVFRAARVKGNLKETILQIDTARVTKLLLYPASENGKEIELLKEANQWSVKFNNRTAKTEQGSVSSALAAFAKLKPLRFVTSKMEKWNEYSVSDSSTRVKIVSGTEEVGNIIIGRIGYNQSPDGQFNAGGIFTHVRLAGENEVYTVEGFLESSFNKKYNDWRDKSFLRLKKELITEIQFDYPGDSSFSMVKKEKGWTIDNQPADSTKIVNFFSQLEYKNAASFADGFAATRVANVTVTIKSATGVLATVSGWRREAEWVLASSWQPAIYFSSENTGLVKTLFERKKNFGVK